MAEAAVSTVSRGLLSYMAEEGGYEEVAFWHDRATGLRAINNAVDVTNYIMFSLGAPSHVFDAAKVKGAIRVRGVDGLRVADASVMPTIIRGHTHAPAVLIGEMAADMIRGGR